ncbi:uncharacterized protein [Lolium perenne]|uniref:uncharacterized protein n=1 Tax=Lolium perenne TaxID=4522 RepID=UPI0021F62C7F|nr:uncharacterized protein LOC127332685 [Lolium perenne]
MEEAATASLRRREEKKRRQRLAAITLGSGEYFNSVSAVPVQDSGSTVRRPRFPTPIMSPSTFLLENFDAAEWVLVQRRRRRFRRTGPVKNRWTLDHSVHRRQRWSATYVPSQIQHKENSNFEHPVFELGRAIACAYDDEPICHVPGKGSMGPERVIASRAPTRVTRFDRGQPCRLGFGKSPFCPAPRIPPLVPAVAAVMNRGGGNPTRGGRGNGRWEGGGTGPPQGGRSSFEQGGPSGYAGHGGNYGAGAERSNDVFGDGIFRAGHGRPNNAGGGFRNQQSFNRGYNRSFGGNNFNRRPSNTYVRRDDPPRDGPDLSGLNDAQRRIVKEAAEAFAKQILATSSSDSVPHDAALPIARESGRVTPTVRQTQVARPSEVSRTFGTNTVGVLVQGGAPAERNTGAGLSQNTVPNMTSDLALAAAAKKKGPECFRCHKTGHCINDCIAVLCDVCQSADHATRDCPTLRAPRPRIAVYGVGHVDLTFWKIPLSGDVRPRVENTRLGKVAVEGGIMTIPELIAQLQFLMPDDQYQWDVQQMEDNVFRVNFPSRSDLVKAQHFGKFCVPKSQITLSFDFWRKDVEPVWTAEEVWVRVHGFPPFALDEIVALWAFGDIFGETTDIDIPYTRANNVLRIRISCLDPALIPTSLDVKIRNDFFRLSFEVEGLRAPTTVDDGVSEDMHKDDDMDHDGPTKNSGDDIDREVKRKKNEEESKDSDYEPSHPDPSAGTSIAVSPFKGAQNNENLIVHATPSAAADLDLCDGNGDSLYPAETSVDELEANLMYDEQGSRRINLVDQRVVEAAVCVHGTCTQRAPQGKEIVVCVPDTCTQQTSIGASGGAVHGACRGDVGASTETPISAANGACSTASSMPRAVSSSTARVLSSTPISSSLVNATKGLTSSPLGTSKRTYVHTVTPKRNSTTNTTVSTLPLPVKDMAGLATKMSTTPGIMTTPVSPALFSDEVIAYGGIKSQEAKGIRSSGRLRAQPNADATQLEKAMLLAQRRNESFAQGHSSSCALDTVMGFPATGGAAQGYGYWLQQTAGAYSGLLLPGYWVATH